jgi:ribosomal protein L44E
MKIPKKIKRFCPKCHKSTEQKVDVVSTGHKRGTLTWGSLSRAKARGKGRGKGNLGRWGSKKAIKSWKRKTKTSMRRVLIYTCQTCKKSTIAKKSRRVSKIMIE